MLNLAFHSIGFAHLAFAGLQAKVEHSNSLYPANLVAAKATIMGLSLTCHAFVYHSCTSVLRPQASSLAALSKFLIYSINLCAKPQRQTDQGASVFLGRCCSL
uniref:Uncharacterized protein n=1 Tax=Ixodes ricinus TaxID=34613 RepID=A0A6B0UFX0_IXORI